MTGGKKCLETKLACRDNVLTCLKPSQPRLFSFQTFYEFPSMNQYQCPPVTSTASKSPASDLGAGASLPPPFYHSDIKPENWPPPQPPPLPPSSGATTVLPPDPVSSAASALPGLEADVPPLCAGCRLRIEDKFYLTAVDVKWHSACLKCAECGVELETQSSCFERDGHIYCKEDYRR